MDLEYDIKNDIIIIIILLNGFETVDVDYIVNDHLSTKESNTPCIV